MNLQTYRRSTKLSLSLLDSASNQQRQLDRHLLHSKQDHLMLSRSLSRRKCRFRDRLMQLTIMPNKPRFKVHQGTQLKIPGAITIIGLNGQGLLVDQIRHHPPQQLQARVAGCVEMEAVSLLIPNLFLSLFSQRFDSKSLLDSSKSPIVQNKLIEAYKF